MVQAPYPKYYSMPNFPYMCPWAENILHVKIIESDFKRCEELAGQLSKAMVLHGDGTDAGLLKSEKIDHCQALISVTKDEACGQSDLPAQ